MTSPHKSKPTYAAREETALEAAVNREWNAAQRLLSVLATAESVETHMPELHGAIFCGHLVADLDSVAGAIGAFVPPIDWLNTVSKSFSRFPSSMPPRDTRWSSAKTLYFSRSSGFSSEFSCYSHARVSQ